MSEVRLDYRRVERSRTSSAIMRVYLDGKYVGVVRVVSGGFSYFPKGQKDGGEVFGTVAEVQQSLEPEEQP